MFFELNLLGILLATVAQFIVGFLWYGPLFGNLWGKMHGFDKLSKATQKKMMNEMGPYYGVQAVVTLITSFVLALFITYSGWNPYALAGFLWIGFIVPAQVSAVIFGGTEKKWITSKISVQAGGALACLEVGAVVIALLK